MSTILDFYDRPNLFLDYREWKGNFGDESMNTEVIRNNLSWILPIVLQDECPKMLIFVPDCNVMGRIFSWLFVTLLKSNKVPTIVNQVFGGSSSSHKADILQKFSTGTVRIVVCTSVWSNGIDFNNVRLVLFIYLQLRIESQKIVPCFVQTLFTLNINIMDK